MTPEERQALREWHTAQIGFHRLDEVEMCQCGTFRWPCDVIRVLDAWEADVKCDHFEKFIGIMIPQSGEDGQVAESAKFTYCPKCGEKL